MNPYQPTEAKVYLAKKLSFIRMFFVIVSFVFGYLVFFKLFYLVQYVYKADGFTGLYRGFGCSLLSKVVCWYTTTKVDEVV